MAQSKEERIVEWNKGVTRPGQVHFQSTDHERLRLSNFQPKPASIVDATHITYKVGECPCDTCGHTHMSECEPRDGSLGCRCCSRFCT